MWLLFLNDACVLSQDDLPGALESLRHTVEDLVVWDPNEIWKCKLIIPSKLFALGLVYVCVCIYTFIHTHKNFYIELY